MAAQTWSSLRVMLLAALVKAQPPYTAAVAAFDALFPQATSYAEARIYRDLILLATRQENTSLVTVAGSRTIELAGMVNASGGPIIVPEGFSLITPAGSTSSTGTRVPFDYASLDVIDQIWPQESLTVAPSLNSWGPRYWALRSDHAIVYAPTADAAYTVNLTGLFQPTPISSANPSTYLSTVYPELLEAACMIWLTGALLHNFGAQSDNPQQSMSWEAIYHPLMVSARNEEMRRRGLAPDALPPSAGANK